MGSLFLFVALSHGGSVDYDHGYYTETSRGNAAKWVSIVERMRVVGTYTTTTVKPQAALILEHKNGYEIMTLDSFRKYAGSLGLSVKKKRLPVFDDSDLSVPFKYEPVMAPIPASAKRAPAAPPPRAMGVYFTDDGTPHTYSREYFDANGIKQMRIHEGDPDFEEFVPDIRVPPGEGGPDARGGDVMPQPTDVSVIVNGVPTPLYGTKLTYLNAIRMAGMDAKRIPTVTYENAERGTDGFYGDRHGTLWHGQSITVRPEETIVNVAYTAEPHACGGYCDACGGCPYTYTPTEDELVAYPEPINR